MLNISFGQSYVNNVKLSKGNYIDKSILFIKSEEELKEEKLMMEVIEYLGTPYRYGGTSKKGIDCSAFVQTVYYLAFNITLPRTSINQFDEGRDIPFDSLQFGDLVFFKTTKRKVGHVGIYLDSNKFVHSGRSKGVSIANLTDEYYLKRFVKGKRIGIDINN